MPGKRQGFNDRLLRVIQLGNQAALAARSGQICTEHLLLGLLRGGSGFAARVLTTLGVDLTLRESSVVSALPAARDPEDQRELPFSSLSERVFHYAREEAASLKQNHVGTSHLLLGLLKVEEGAALKLLAGVGVTYGKARAEVIKIVDDLASPQALPVRDGRIAQKPADQASGEPMVDPALIEETKMQIRRAVIEIANLAKQDISSLEFYRVFLDRVIACLAAKGGAVWTISDTGTLELAYHTNLPANVRDNKQQNRRRSLRSLVDDLLRRAPSVNRPNSERHAMLLQKTLSGGEAVLVQPHSGEDDGVQPGNPTDSLLVLGLLEVDRRPKGVVEIFQRPGAPPTTQRGYLKFVGQMCELASGYLNNHQ